MTHLYLYTPTVKRSGKPQLLEGDELKSRQGFRSVFGYPDTTAAVIAQNGNTRKLKGMELYLDCLLVDFDNCEDDADRFGEYLRDNGIGHEVYDSGNRSQHYHVPTKPLTSRTLPRDVRHWVQLHAPGADLTIYTTSGLFRLPGTWHEKNPGRRKQLTAAYEGDKLIVPKSQRPHYFNSAIPEAKVADRKLSIGLSARKSEGGRRCYVYYLAKNAHDAGYPEEAALGFITQWNMKCASPPLDLADIERKVSEAYDE